MAYYTFESILLHLQFQATFHKQTKKFTYSLPIYVLHRKKFVVFRIMNRRIGKRTFLPVVGEKVEGQRLIDLFALFYVNHGAISRRNLYSLKFRFDFAQF